MLDVSRWLAEQGLGHHAEAFAATGIASDVLRDLTDADLKELGLNLGDRKRLLKAIAALHSVPTAIVPEPAVPPPGPVAPREPERRQLTMMFVDLVGSTALSSRLDPEETREIISAYHLRVGEVIGGLGGRVARFMGDGVLAYFGFPQAHEDDAERAVRAGLAAVAATAGLRAAGEPLAARVGIATGLVVAGELIGEGPPWEEAVVGETPNLAARLQALAGPGVVVIAERTRQLVGGLFDVADLGTKVLKGFAEPVPVWQVTGIGRAGGRFEALRGAALTPLVGRVRELALLLDYWLRAKEGEGRVVLLSGEPGIGKSRLVRALRDRLGAEQHTSLCYQCSPHHAGSALWPLIEQLERAAGITRDDPPEANLDRLELLLGQAVGEVGTAAPLIADLLGLPTAGRYPPPDLTPRRRKALTFEALLAQLAGLAARGPVLVVLEDAQWIDPTSQELFEQVVARIRRLPVLLVITFRPDFCAPWISEPHSASLTLARFGRKQAKALAEQVAGRALPAEVLAQILARTDGVPLFVEELTKTVLEAGLVEERDGRYLLKGPLPAIAIPATLNDSLMARLDRLAVAKEVAQISAVIGREFSHELLLAVADRSVAELDAALRRLTDAELIFRRGMQPKAVYSFKHALVRDAAYESLLKSTRQRLHARIARALEQHFQQTVRVRPDLVAYHYAQAKLIREAVPHYLQAGRNAVRRSATIEATDQLKAGLTLLEGYPDGPERARMELGLQIALGDALRAAKGSAVTETGAAYARARTFAMMLDAKVELIRATHGVFNFHFSRAELNKARETAGSLMEVANELGEIEARSIGLEAAGLVAFSSGDLFSARVFLEKVLSIRSSESEATLATYAGDAASMSYLSWTLLILGTGYP